MRTIKFRGKGDSNRRWVYGYFYEECDSCYIFENCQESSMINRNVCYEVDENTIEQFTGVYDKNGKEVYEGDIVDAWSAGHHSTCNVIKYVAPKFFISLINKETGETSDFWHLSPNAFGKDELLEVIGNIHDNPELLKSNPAT